MKNGNQCMPAIAYHVRARREHLPIGYCYDGHHRHEGVASDDISAAEGGRLSLSVATSRATSYLEISELIKRRAASVNEA